MVRDDLYITVPSFFKCPISLDVMKSPVSLCTGVTYDRSSIQRWLDNGNNTCPATMQVLQSKDIVPNRNLQRLIQIWLESVRHRLESDESLDSHSVPSEDQVSDFIKKMGSNKSRSNCFDCLMKLVCFAGESEENRKFLSKFDGFLQILVDLLCNVDDEDSGNLDLIELTVRLLDFIRGEIEDKEQLTNSMLKRDRNCLNSLLLVLRQGKLESQIGSARILESIAIDAESKLAIAEKDGLLTELIKTITPDKDPSLIESVLSCLISVSMTKRIKGKLIKLGAIKSLTKLLSEPNWNASVTLTEKILKLLETTSSVKEGRLEICQDSTCLAAIVQKVLKVSNSATEHAVTILWSVCYLFRDERAQEIVTTANGLTKILLLMQSNCSPSIRHMATDLLKIFRVHSKSCLSSYDTKTTHIMPW